MEIFDYTKNVKTHKEGEILSQIDAINVNAAGLQANLKMLAESNVDVSDAASKWVIPRGVIRHLENQGFRGNTYLQIVDQSLSTVLSLTTELRKLVKDYRENIWDGKTITLRQTNILNVIEYLNFWVNYSAEVSSALVTMSSENKPADRALSKHEIQWINGTEDFYKAFTTTLLKGSRAITEQLKQIQDVDVSAEVLDVLEGTDGLGAVSLVSKGFGVHLINPVFWFSLGQSKINLRRIENMRKRNDQFAMKISQAINLRNGTNDPQLQRRIEIYQDEIIANEAAIRHIEAQYE